ncbi:hypothetical protein RCL1_004431 [Eukaryota sp. TZLM3-RCL]
MGSRHSRPRSQPPPSSSTHHRHGQQSRPRTSSTLGSIIGNVLGHVAKSAIAFSLAKLCIALLEERIGNVAISHRQILEMRLFSAFSLIFNGHTAAGMAQLIPIVVLLFPDNPEEILRVLLSKAHEEDEHAPSAPPAPIFGRESTHTRTPISQENYSRLVSLGCDTNKVANIPNEFAHSCAEAIETAVSENATDPISLEPLTVNGRLRPGVTALIHPRHPSGNHVFLFDTEELSEWTTYNQTNPLTRETITNYVHLS